MTPFAEGFAEEIVKLAEHEHSSLGSALAGAGFGAAGGFASTNPKDLEDLKGVVKKRKAILDLDKFIKSAPKKKADPNSLLSQFMEGAKKNPSAQKNLWESVTLAPGVKKRILRRGGVGALAGAGLGYGISKLTE